MLLTLSMCGFVFEYFASCRGYGLAMMFMMLGIWMLFKYLESHRTLDIILMGVMLWFAVFSNMTILVSSFLIFGFVCIHLFRQDYKKNRREWFKKMLVLLLIGAPFIYHAKWALKMKESGLLVYGNLESLYKTTIGTLSEHILGTFNIGIGLTVQVIFWSIFLFTIIRLISSKSIDFLMSKNGLFIFLILSSVITVLVFANFFKINYPRDRVGMNLWIFFVCGFIFFLSALNEKWKWTKYFSLILLVIPINFIVFANPYNSQNWDGWRHSDRIYKSAVEQESNFKFPLIVSTWIRQDLPWYYANHQNGGNQGGAFSNGFPALESDIILKGPEDNNWVTPSIPDHYDLMYLDPFTRVAYYKRKQFLEKELIYTVDVQEVLGSKDEYLAFASIGCDSLIGEALYFGIEMTLTAESKPFRSRMIAAIDGTTKEDNLLSEIVQFDWLRPSFSGEENNVLQGIFISQVPENSKMLSLFLWNPDKTSFTISNSKCYLYRVVRDF